jgi:Tfp pilus assembly protein PilF
MFERTKVVSPRAASIWLLVTVNVVVLVALAMCGLLIYPPLQDSRKEWARRAEAEQRYQAGVAFQNMGDWAAAEAEFKQVVALGANHQDVQTRLAEVREKSVTATAKALESRYQAGVAFQKMGDLESAEKEYRQVVAVDPDYQDAMTRLAVVVAAASTATAKTLEAH